MTEDDTFRKLLRPTINEMRQIIINHGPIGGWTEKDAREFLSGYFWSLSDYREEVRKLREIK